jgi:hypothetical protein
MGWEVGVRFLAGASFHTGSGANPVSYPVGSGAFSLELKRPGPETDHSLFSDAEVKNSGAILPLPQTSSWRVAELIKHRNNFTSFFTSDSKFVYRNVSVVQAD